MRSLFTIGVFLLALCAQAKSDGYSKPTDAELWLSAGVSYKINKRFSLGISETVRLNKYMTNLSAAITGVEISYRKKWVKLDAGYDFFYRTTELRNRCILALNTKYEKKKISINNRLRYDFNFYQRTPVRHVLRDQVSVGWAFKKKWDAEMSNEIFWAVNYERAVFYQNRFAASISYAPKKHHSIQLKEIFQTEFDTAYPANSFITSIGYEYRF